jgi:heme-degrading monooxygenase HmoA
MFIRLTFISIAPEKAAELKSIYLQEIVPVVKKQKGNIGIRLLEPTNTTEEYISLTEWETPADADAYESSGTYRNLVNLIKNLYRSKPILKTYNVIEAQVAAKTV